MKQLGFYWSKFLSKIKHNTEPTNNFYRKHGVTIGKNCLICSYILTGESFLLSIGDNTTISTNVTFVTHDYSIHLVVPGSSDMFGRITIGNDCFIGTKSILMYGVELGDKVIVAAGSVVTKSFKESGIIIGGNPAKIIGKWDQMAVKYEKNAVKLKTTELLRRIDEDDSFLVKR